MPSVDPVTLQVIQARLAGIVQEMQNSLFRTGYSTIIRESQDASCAILNRQGEVVAQHVVLPLHMGAFPACAAGILKNYSADEVRERSEEHTSELQSRRDLVCRLLLEKKKKKKKYKITVQKKQDDHTDTPIGCTSRRGRRPRRVAIHLHRHLWGDHPCRPCIAPSLSQC